MYNLIGTPIERSPDHDDPSIANDDNEVNNFTYDQKAGQSRCPFAAHIRKSNPRNDIMPVESAFRHLSVSTLSAPHKQF
jgi:deferrochelatase/peroxidase EfeB